ncbi:MAG: phospholipase D-like domain-containing protein, partial [Oscillospiraceae bacterium]|nr:phospholipase D-like domain-containing protein [Oscillospiraceae bacterium]
MKKFISKFVRTIKRIFNRTVICVLGILIQLSYLIWLFWMFGTTFSYSYWIFEVAAILIAFTIVNSDKHPSYKISWILPILIMPIFGVMLYVCFGNGNSAAHLRKRMNQFNEEEHLLLTQNNEIIKQLQDSDDIEIKSVEKQANYLYNYGGYPIYTNSQVTYFECGEAKFTAMCEELEKAQRFIFLEYFIVQEGVMWDTILEILERKVKEGVDVRMVYDDIGCLKTLPYKYYEKMEKKGIKCKTFNKFHPFWVARMNNRDHRKILVIDGHTAFNGGVNLADEYINAIKRFGDYWKDSAVMIKGEAVWSFTMMFLTMWNYLNNAKPHDCNDYMPQ